MQEVATELRSWSTFYAAFAEASAALLGLLFVAISLQSGSWRRSVRLSLEVNQSGIELLYPLLASLLMLVPAGAPTVHGGGLLVLSATGLVSSIRRGGHGADAPRSAMRPSWNNVVGATAALLYGVSGIGLLLDEPIGVYGVALASFLMIVAGTVNTWAILVREPTAEE